MKVKIEININEEEYAKKLEGCPACDVEERVYEMLDEDIIEQVKYYGLDIEPYTKVYKAVEELLPYEPEPDEE